MSLVCPYCQRPQALPPPKAAGLVFRCPYCQRDYRFTGVAAMPIPQATEQAIPIPQFGAVVELRDKRGWGLASGFALFLVGVIAVPAELVMGAAIAVSFPHSMIATRGLTIACVIATVVIGLGGLLAGIVNTLRPN